MLRRFSCVLSAMFLTLSVWDVFAAASGQGDTTVEPAGRSTFEKGMRYFVGLDGAEPNYSEAVRLFLEAAEKGNPHAQYQLGRCFAYGKGVDRNYDESIKWFTLAVGQKLPEAEYELGLRYAWGQGVAQDTLKALDYFRLAAARGSVRGQKMLGFAFDHGQLATTDTIPVTRDHAEAAVWYRRAADSGDASSQQALAGLYYAGRGVPKDHREAVRWLKKAVDQGHVTAFKVLADCYLNGEGVPRDSAEAIRLYRRAAAEELSEPSSQWAVATSMLGYIYRTGTGVSQDYVEAYAYCSLAAAKGDQEARNVRDALAATYLRGSVLIAAQQRAREIKIELEAEKAKSLGSSQMTGTAPKPTSLAGALPSTVKATGSGFAVTTRGIFVTNWHVVEGAARIELLTEHGTVSATVIASDPNNDLAILSADKLPPVALDIRSSRGIKLGTEVFTIGFPNPKLQGFSPKFTRGDISSLAGAGDDPRYFQISVPLQPGNSGGVLCDKDGLVVGVVSARLSGSTALETSGALPENVNYAIKSSYLLALIERLELPQGLVVAESKGKATPDEVRQRVQQAAVLVVVY